MPANVVVWRFYRDAPGRPEAVTCVEEGIAYADNLPTRDPEGFSALTAYAQSHRANVATGFPHRLVVMPISQWLEERLFRYGYKHRDRCRIVGFNVGFDMGSLAKYWSPAEGYYRGGWSLGIWGHFDGCGKWKDLRYHPRFLIRPIDP